MSAKFCLRLRAIAARRRAHRRTSAISPGWRLREADRSSSTAITPMSAINTGRREPPFSTSPTRASRRFSAPSRPATHGRTRTRRGSSATSWWSIQSSSAVMVVGARISRWRLSYLRHQGQDKSQACDLRENLRQGRASFRCRRKLRLYLHRNGGLRRQHPGHLRYPQSVQAGGGLALVDGTRQNVAGERRPTPQAGRASPAPCDALRHRDVCRLLDVGHLDHRRERHQQAANTVAL